MTRFLSYNVRHGQGVLSPVSLRRTARMIASLRPDVVMLSELYRWPGRYDQPALIARALGMSQLFQANVVKGRLEYGNAILSRWPLELVSDVHLPKRREARGLLVGAVEMEGTRVIVAATHLSLHRKTRAEQLEVIAGVLVAHACANTRAGTDAPTVLAGDFNCEPRELGPLLGSLRMAEHPPPTYPSVAPVAHYDHILWSDHWRLDAIATSRSLASDHLPIHADLDLDR